MALKRLSEGVHVHVRHVRLIAHLLIPRRRALALVDWPSPFKRLQAAIGLK